MIPFTAFIFLFLTIVYGQLAIGEPQPGQETERTKIAEGEYRISEHSNDGAIGPFEQEVYNFNESFTIWRTSKDQYQVEGLRKFDSPKEISHSNRFVVELTRDFTVIRAKEFAKLRWISDSGPLSCEFLAKQLECSSGGSDPKRELKIRTPLEKPYGLLWPISPFSFTGITRQVERDRTKPTLVDLVRIEQPGMANPVQVSVLEGPLLYLGDEEIDAAGRKWRAHKFSLKIPLEPEFMIWTSAKGLLLALAMEHGHKDWAEEGIRLETFESSTDF